MKQIFSLRWMVTTVLVILGVGVLVRLGIWQLDRLEWRRAFNERASAQLAAPLLDLNRWIPVSQLYDMEYRSVVVAGVYDHSQEVLLRNQVWEGRLGYRVLTPLIIDRTHTAVLVDRGWIPFEDGDPDRRTRYDEPGQVAVMGMIRRPQEKPEIGGVPDPTLAPGETRLDAWTVVNIARIQEQSGLEMLPVWIQQAPDDAWVGPPYRALPEIEITEGPHMGYALQWFAFAAILGTGYPFFLWRQLSGMAGAKTGQPRENNSQQDGVRKTSSHDKE